MSLPTWITGPTRSGKTTRLLELLNQWGQQVAPFPGFRRATPFSSSASPPPLAPDASKKMSPSPVGRSPSLIPNRRLLSNRVSRSATRPANRGNRGVLVFAANGDNRIALSDTILERTKGQVAFDSATPLGFFETEINLFWPLVAQEIDSTLPFPLRLRPETEQELATRLWQQDLDQGQLQQDGVRDYYMVRRTLDLLQLAASAGVPISDIPSILKAGMGEAEPLGARWACMGDALQRWSTWCLDRGLVTYGLISDLYWRVLLPHPIYQSQLRQRYWAVFADDVDEYPAIAHILFTTLLNNGVVGVFTFNPDGSVRRGLGADADHLAQLQDRCEVEALSPQPNLAEALGPALWQGIIDPIRLGDLPTSLHSIQTVSRAELLRQLADVIYQAVSSKEISPADIAILGPGVDPIARYALREMLGPRGIAVDALNEQRAIASSSTVRALLTLMGLVYPGLGRLINREEVAEMLVILSQQPTPTTATASNAAESPPRIDPVRAGLIVDHCFKPDPLHPELLPVEAFPRWDRLGYQGTQTYGDIRQWITTQQQQQQQRLLLNPVTLLDRAIQYFLLGGSHLPYDRLAVLRELMETAQHYWDVDARLRQQGPTPNPEPVAHTVGRFIQLLRNGTITADPFPTRSFGQAAPAVTLATLFQYRSNRRVHRWQFWLDAGSSLWLTGGEPLFGAPLFLQNWTGRLWTEAETQQASQERFRCNMFDLLGRCTERVYLCHSDLATGGYEQTGPMLPIIERALVDEDPEAIVSAVPGADPNS